MTDVQTVSEAEEKQAYVQGRNSFFCSVVDWYNAGRLPQEHLNRLLANAWSAAEWPARLAKASDLDEYQIVEMFRVAGFVTDTFGIDRPAESLRVYRGCTEYGAKGFSWSTDPAVARRFAKRPVWFARDEDEYGEPVIVTTVIDPEYVLAVFSSENGRKEREVVIDPTGLDTEAMDYLYDLDEPDIEAVAELLSAERTALSALSDVEWEDWMRRVVFDLMTEGGPIHVLLVGKDEIIAYPHDRDVHVHHVDDYEPTGHEASLPDDWWIEFADCSDGLFLQVRRIEHPTDVVIGFSEKPDPCSIADWKGWGYAWNIDHPQASAWKDFGTVTFVSEGHRLTRHELAALNIAILANRPQTTGPKPIVQGGELTDDAREGPSGHIQWLVDCHSAVIDPSVRKWERPESVLQSYQDELE